MTTHFREICDGRRIARFRAVVSSFNAGRVMLLIGLAGAAWLAGAAAAHADPIAGTATDGESVSPVSSAQMSNVDVVNAEPEQAALAPANQLESFTTKILDVPDALLSTDSADDANQAKHTVAVSADPATNGTDDGESISSTVDGSPVPAGTDAATVSAGRSRPVLGLTQSVIDPVANVAEPMITPLAAAGQPVAASFGAVTFPVTRTLAVIGQPVVGAEDSIGVTFARMARNPDVPGMFPAFLMPSFGSGHHSTGSSISTSDGVVAAHGQYQAWNAPAELQRHHVSGQTPDGGEWIRDALQRHGAPMPFSTTAGPDFGLAVTGGASTGNGLSGASSHDSGFGWSTLVHADRDAQVSRVTPLTAVWGQLPELVEDPVVSPD